MGPDYARCNKILKEISNLISFFAHGNCMFPPLPKIGVSNFGCKLGAKIYLFAFCGRWFPLDSCWTRQDVSRVSCCLSCSSRFTLKNPLTQASRWSWTMLPSKLQGRNCRKVRRSVSKVAEFGEDFFVVLKVSCCGVASWTLRNLATSLSNIWICFQVMWLEWHGCTAEAHAGESLCSSSPPLSWWTVLYLSFFFGNALFLFLLLFSYVQAPAQVISLSTFLVTPNVKNPGDCLFTHFTKEWALFCDTFYVFCFHLYKLQA